MKKPIEIKMTRKIELYDKYHTAKQYNDRAMVIGNALGYEIKLDYYSLKDVYESTRDGFLELILRSYKAGLDVGWSNRHHDGELCFGGGWAICWIVSPSGKQARLHFEEAALESMVGIKQYLGSPWNHKEETDDAITEIGTYLGNPDLLVNKLSNGE